MGKKVVQVMVTAEELMAAGDELFKTHEAKLKEPAPTGTQYRKAALTHYRRDVSGTEMNVCVVCGFGIQSVLEVAHLDQIRKNNAIDNLAILCPNCHKMHDIGLIPTDVIRLLRDANAKEDWKLRIKDAGVKAAKTKKMLATKEKKSEAAKRAWTSRNSNGKQKENS